MAKKKIKPCPFCGESASVKLMNGHYLVTCDNEDCCTKFDGWLTEALAINEWNTRLKPVKAMKGAKDE